MRSDARIVIWMSLLLAFVAPLVVGTIGALRPAPGTVEVRHDDPVWDWRLTAASAVLYALAFNLVFLLQELCLVLSKAVTPGLYPVLYHNNHDWTGTNPLARLLQGAGALGILLLGVGVSCWLIRRPPRSITLRLFAIWVAFSGIYQSLPQVVIGAVLPRNDVGMAMDYLALGPVVRQSAALAALIAMAVVGWCLAGQVLALADDAVRLAMRRSRMCFVFRSATLPALAGTVLVLPFRVPGPGDQVYAVPITVALVGSAWVQATAWRSTRLRGDRPARRVEIALALLTLVGLLLVFQVILRPGLRFY